jgi:hypothetical protein
MNFFRETPRVPYKIDLLNFRRISLILPFKKQGDKPAGWDPAQESRGEPSIEKLLTHQRKCSADF